MYLLVYPSPTDSRCSTGLTADNLSGGARVDFITPDGQVVPRAAGEAALLRHTAVLVGGLFVGIWSQV